MLQALADGETSPAALAALAHQRYAATVVRRTRRFEGSQRGLSSAPEDDLARLAMNRRADGPVEPRDCESAEPISGCGAAVGRGPGFGVD